MSELYLIRHGQASFDSDDYDKLSDTGHQQAAILADYWQSLGVQFDAIYSGSLLRQLETAAGVSKQVAEQQPTVLEGLNEYSGDQVLTAYRQQFAEQDGFSAAGNMKDRKYFQRILETACQRWVKGELESENLEPFAEFKQRVRDALEHIMSGNAKGRQLAVTTSGGVIAIAVQSILHMPDEQAINLNWMVYNTSITRIPFSGSRKSLSVFNAIPHLERPGFIDKITYR